MPDNNVTRIALMPVALILAWLLLGASSTAAAQDCRRPTVVARPTPVYAQPATAFNTASGWVYGQPVAVLGAKVKVFLCSEFTAYFGPIFQGWSQIAYWDGKGWQHGWVVSSSLRGLAHNQPSTLLALLAELTFLVPSAQAQPLLITEDPPAKAGSPPPPPSQLLTGAIPSVDDRMVGTFYVILFVCMLLGMLAKILFDALTDKKRIEWTKRARAAVLPVLVSPIVFLTIMQAANADQAVTLASFIAVACSAFQNGFFWHVILERAR
jgi:hypothetical protein